MTKFRTIENKSGKFSYAAKKIESDRNAFCVTVRRKGIESKVRVLSMGVVSKPAKESQS